MCIRDRCQDGRSQHSNRDVAWQRLRSKLYDFEMRKRMEEQQKLEDTKTDVGWGHQLSLIHISMCIRDRFMAGRSDRERGATAAPGHAVWPNPQHSQKVPKDASLTGTHAVSGEGIPASLQFAIGQAQDFMPKLALTAQGGGAAATLLQWPALAHARASFFNAMGLSLIHL